MKGKMKLPNSVENLKQNAGMGLNKILICVFICIIVVGIIAMCFFINNRELVINPFDESLSESGENVSGETANKIDIDSFINTVSEETQSKLQKIDNSGELYNTDELLDLESEVYVSQKDENTYTEIWIIEETAENSEQEILDKFEKRINKEEQDILDEKVRETFSSKENIVLKKYLDFTTVVVSPKANEINSVLENKINEVYNDLSASTIATSGGTSYTLTNNTKSFSIIKADITGSVTIKGTVKYNSQLTAQLNNISPSGCTYKYQWYWNSSNNTTSGTAISGATSQYYTVGSGLAGKYIYVKVTVEKANYNTLILTDITDSGNNGNATVTKIQLQKPTFAGSYTYNGQQQQAKETTSGIFNASTMNITGNTGTDASTYTVKVSLKDTTNYEWASGGTADLTYTWTIAKKNVTANWESKTTFVYNGTDQAPTVSAQSGVTGETLVLSRTTGRDVGTYTSNASISRVNGGRGKASNYTLTNTSCSFSITTANGYVTLESQNGTSPYGTPAVTFNISSYHGGTLSVEVTEGTPATASVSGTTVTISNLSTLPAGTTVKVTVTSEATHNYYSAFAEYTLTIIKADITPVVNMASYTYAGIKSEPTVSGNIEHGTETFYYTTTNSTTGGTNWNTVADSTSLNAGTYYMYVEIGETANYNGATSVPTQFEVMKANITGSVTITGTVKYKSKLTAELNNILPEGCTYKYQWYWNSSNSTTGGTAIQGATSQEYIIGPGLAGKYIYVEVTLEKPNYNTKILTDITYVVANYQDNASTINYYTTLNEAFENATSGSTITVLKDVADNVPTTLDESKMFTLDLNSKTIDASGVTKDVNNGGRQFINNLGTLTVVDTGDQGKIERLEAEANCCIIATKGTLNLKAGTFNLTAGSNTGDPSTISLDNGTMNVSGTATITAERTAEKKWIAAIFTANGNLNISGGTIKATGIENNPGITYGIINRGDGNVAINMTGGIIETNGSGIMFSKREGNTNNGDNLNVSGTAKISGYYGINNTFAIGGITITGGTITGNDAGIYQTATNDITVTNAKITGQTKGIYLPESTSGGTITINDGAVITGEGDDGIRADGKQDIVINGGNITSNVYCAIYHGGAGNVTVNGGTLIGTLCGIKVENSSTNVTVKDGNINGKQEYGILLTDTATGSLIITGGQIVGETNEGVIVKGQSNNVVIGTLSGGVSITNPMIQGETYGLQSVPGFKFYDGILKGKTEAFEGEVLEKEFGYGITHEIQEDLKVAYLAVTNYTDGTYVYSSLNKAFMNAENGKTITPLKDVEDNIEAVIDAGKTYTLDLDGKVITVNKAGITDVFNFIQNEGNLIIEDGKTGGNIQVTGVSSVDNAKLSMVHNSGILKIKSGSYSVTGESVQNINAIESEGGEVYFEGREIVVVGNGANSETYNTYGISGSGSVKINVNNGTVKGETAIHMGGNGSLIVAGNDTVVEGRKCGIENAMTGGTINIKTGTVRGLSEDAISGTGTGNVILGVLGESVSIEKPVLEGGRYGISCSNGFDFYDGIIKGKTDAFDSKVNQVEEGYGPTHEVQDEFKVSYLILANYTDGTYYYETLNNAFTKAEDGSTIKPLKETITETETATVADNKTYILDLDGKIITSNIEGQNFVENLGALRINDETGTGKITMTIGKNVIQNNGNLTIESGIFENNTTENSVIQANNSSNTTISGGTITGATGIELIGGNVSINNGTVTGNKTAGISNKGEGTVSVIEGTVSGVSYGIEMSNNGQEVKGTLTITGGTITGGTNGICQTSDGTITVTGGSITGTNAEGINNTGTGEVIIGEKGEPVSITNPMIQGGTYGLNVTSGFKFYDGILKGKIGAFNGNVLEVEPIYAILYREEGEYKTAILSLGNYSVGTNYFLTLLDAYNSITENKDTIVTERDNEDNSELVIGEGKDITLDTNAKTITKTVFGIQNKGTFTIKGTGTITTGTEERNGLSDLIKTISGTLNIKEGVTIEHKGVSNKAWRDTLAFEGENVEANLAGNIRMSFPEGQQLNADYSADVIIIKNVTEGHINITNGEIVNEITEEQLNRQTLVAISIDAQSSSISGLLKMTGGEIVNETGIGIQIYDDGEALDDTHEFNIEVDGGEINCGGLAIRDNIDGESEVIIKNGTLSGGTDAIHSYKDANIKIEGGTITGGNNAIVTNGAGKVEVTGGKLIGNSEMGIKQTGTANVIIGTEVEPVSIENPSIEGMKYGLYSTTGFSFYDGILKGGEAAFVGEVNKVEQDYEVYKDETEEYKKAYLKKGIMNVELLEDNLVYDAEEQKPVIRVTWRDLVLEEGKDYEVKYENNINVGTGKIIVKGIGEYTGRLTTTFTIIPAEIVGKVTITGNNMLGETLTVDTSGIVPEGCDLTYKWYYNDEENTENGIEIVGATEDSLELLYDYIGKYIYVEVTARKENYNLAVFKDITDSDTNGSAFEEKKDGNLQTIPSGRIEIVKGNKEYISYTRNGNGNVTAVVLLPEMLSLEKIDERFLIQGLGTGETKIVFTLEETDECAGEKLELAVVVLEANYSIGEGDNIRFYNKLEDALKEGGKITVLKNVEDKSTNLKVEKDVEIDLNGFDVLLENGALKVENGGNLKVKGKIGSVLRSKISEAIENIGGMVEIGDTTTEDLNAPRIEGEERAVNGDVIFNSGVLVGNNNPPYDAKDKVTIGREYCEILVEAKDGRYEARLKKEAIAPTIEISQDIFELTKENVTLTVVVRDEGSGVKEVTYTIDDVNKKLELDSEGKATIVVEKNGMITIRAEDRAGNISVKEYEVSNIDKISGNVVSVGIEGMTTNEVVENAGVILERIVVDARDIKEILISNKDIESPIESSDWLPYVEGMRLPWVLDMTEGNGDKVVYFWVKDKVGNVSQEAYIKHIKVDTKLIGGTSNKLQISFAGIDANFKSSVLSDANVSYEVEGSVLQIGSKILETTSKNFVQGNKHGIEYTATLINLKGVGNLLINIGSSTLLDMAGNKNNETTLKTDITIDTIAPVLTIKNTKLIVDDKEGNLLGVTVNGLLRQSNGEDYGTVLAGDIIKAFDKAGNIISYTVQ